MQLESSKTSNDLYRAISLSYYEFGTLVVGNHGTIIRKFNNRGWGPQSFEQAGNITDFHSVIFNGNLTFLAVGYKNATTTRSPMVSATLLHTVSPRRYTPWEDVQTQSAFANEFLTDVVWSGIKFMLVGSNGYIACSNDGQAWSQITTSNPCPY